MAHSFVYSFIFVAEDPGSSPFHLSLLGKRLTGLPGGRPVPSRLLWRTSVLRAPEGLPSLSFRALGSRQTRAELFPTQFTMWPQPSPGKGGALGSQPERSKQGEEEGNSHLVHR